MLKQFQLYNYITLAIISSMVLLFGCKSKSSKIIEKSAPVGLSVEYIRQPQNTLIIDLKPEFAWELPRAAVQQWSYQILVASSKEFIENDNGDIWNSGKIESSNSVNIAFNGATLEVGETYFWKVKIWDINQKETQFSEIQRFKTGVKKGVITSANSFQIDKIKPTKIQKTSNNSYFIDFGKDAFATLKFNYKTATKDTLVFHIGEQLIHGEINRNPEGTIRYQKIKVPVIPNIVEYQLKITPDKRNTKSIAVALPDSFPVLMPFRYVEVENVKYAITADNFTQLVYRSYWEDDESYFKSSDSILNQVWDLCKYTIKATTFAGLYVDGDRERIPYEADAYLNQLSHYTTDKEYAMARQTIEYFMENPTWPTEWQLHVALMFHADYMYTGNSELIEKYYDELKHKTLMELKREDGLISSSKSTPEFMKKLGFKNKKTKLKDIVDWPPAQKDSYWKLATAEGERDGFVFTPINTVINCLYYRNVEIMAEFAQLLGKTAEEKEYRALAAQVKTSINNKLFDKSNRFYKDGEDTNHASLHANMMALAFNIVPEKHVTSVAEFIKSRGMACSVYGAQYLLEALYNANESEYAFSLLTSKENRSWYNMIQIGATMTLESWDMKYKPNSDWNHAWGAAPANIIPRYLWGIKPLTPGYTIASIKPQLEGLNSTSIIVPTIRGKIKAAYALEEDNIERYVIEIPTNMKAEFEVTPTSTVKVNNELKLSKTGVLHLQSGVNNIEVYN